MSIPPLLTEDVGPPPYTGCTFVTALMMASYGGIHLPLGLTTDEHYALVHAAGMLIGHEGATLDDIQRGFQVRYGVQAHLFSGSAVDLKTLGDVYALVQGRYGDLPDHYRRWDPEFLGIHAAGYLPQLGFWQDPLATQRFIGAGFNGESIPLAVVERYALGFGGSIHALYMRVNEFATGGNPAQPVPPVIYSRGGLKTALVKAGTPFAHEPAGPTVGTISADTRFLLGPFDQGGHWVAIDGGYLQPQSTTTTPMGWVTTGQISAFEDVITAAPDCSAAIAADRAKARIVWS